MNKLKMILLVLVATMGPLTAGVGHALPIPLGLNPGDSYRLMFTTAWADFATSASIADYNQFVQSQADMSALTDGTTWAAVVSTVGTNARVNTGTDGNDAIPIFRLDGVEIANGSADLWDGQIQAWLELDQFLDIVPSGVVWTGTLANGDTSALPLGLGPSVTSGCVQVVLGHQWVDCTTVPLQNFIQHFYAISAVLVAPSAAPAPATIPLFVLGIACLGISRRKRAQHR